MEKRIEDIIRRVYFNIKNDNFMGFDPYDCLNSPIIGRIDNRLSRIAATQILVYSPINFRNILKIKRNINPKAIGLVLRALNSLKRKTKERIIQGIDNEIRTILTWLEKNENKGYSGPCWGYHFPWQDLHKYIPRYEPSIVVTSVIGNALMDLEEGQDYDIEAKIRGISRFIMKDLNTYEDKEGICFSYSPHDKNIVHNANLLGASFLFRAGTRLKDNDIIRTSERSLRFSLSKQNPDGSWYYSIDPISGKVRSQNDFHQGFILDSLKSIWDIGEQDEVLRSIEKGIKFYLRTIDEKGRVHFRFPRKWPIDIHNQAQAIITLNNLSSIFPHLKVNRDRVLSWTIEKMIRSDFRTRYQVWPMVNNNISYIRWGDSWFLVALVSSLDEDTYQ